LDRTAKGDLDVVAVFISLLLVKFSQQQHCFDLGLMVVEGDDAVVLNAYLLLFSEELICVSPKRD
jgi:hypothetical protein